MQKTIPADEWKEMMRQDKINKKIPSRFLFRRYTCGICESGIRFQSAWQYDHEEEGGYGYVETTFSYICKQCAPTREQLLFMSLNFGNNMSKYTSTVHYM